LKTVRRISHSLMTTFCDLLPFLFSVFVDNKFRLSLRLSISSTTCRKEASFAPLYPLCHGHFPSCTSAPHLRHDLLTFSSFPIRFSTFFSLWRLEVIMIFCLPVTVSFLICLPFFPFFRRGPRFQRGFSAISPTPRKSAALLLPCGLSVFKEQESLLVVIDRTFFPPDFVFCRVLFRIPEWQCIPVCESHFF